MWRKNRLHKIEHHKCNYHTFDDGHRLQYSVIGELRPRHTKHIRYILLLHDTAGGVDQAMTMAMSQRLDRATDEHTTVIAVSRPGYLGSDIELGGSPDHEANTYLQFLAHYRVKECAVLAYGAAAVVALHMASASHLRREASPPTISQIVLINIGMAAHILNAHASSTLANSGTALPQSHESDLFGLARSALPNTSALASTSSSSSQLAPQQEQQENLLMLFPRDNNDDDDATTSALTTDKHRHASPAMVAHHNDNPTLAMSATVDNTVALDDHGAIQSVYQLAHLLCNNNHDDHNSQMGMSGDYHRAAPRIDALPVQRIQYELKHINERYFNSHMMLPCVLDILSSEWHKEWRQRPHQACATLLRYDSIMDDPVVVERRLQSVLGHKSIIDMAHDFARTLTPLRDRMLGLLADALQSIVFWQRESPFGTQFQQRDTVAASKAPPIMSNRFDWRSVRAPTLIVQGEQDALGCMGTAEHVAALLPHAQLMCVEDAGHLIWLSQDRAWKTFANDLLTGQMTWSQFEKEYRRHNRAMQDAMLRKTLRSAEHEQKKNHRRRGRDTIDHHHSRTRSDHKAQRHTTHDNMAYTTTGNTPTWGGMVSSAPVTRPILFPQHADTIEHRNTIDNDNTANPTVAAGYAHDHLYYSTHKQQQQRHDHNIVASTQWHQLQIERSQQHPSRADTQHLPMFQGHGVTVAAPPHYIYESDNVNRYDRTSAGMRGDDTHAI